MFLIILRDLGLDKEGKQIEIKYSTKEYVETENGWVSFKTYGRTSGKETARLIPVSSVREILIFEKSDE